jgi:uncharacterized protein (DUF488 family)
MLIYTIGFTRKPAERFFGLLGDHGMRRMIDIRLRPHGQLAGFSKQDDLRYFLRELIGCDYAHLPVLAPTDDLLRDYRSGRDEARFREAFEALMDERDIPASLDRALFADGPVCLLCSEERPEGCHRLFVAERLAGSWPDVTIAHLM